jgi:hypothetical protein
MRRIDSRGDDHVRGCTKSPRASARSKFPKCSSPVTSTFLPSRRARCDDTVKSVSIGVPARYCTCSETVRAGGSERCGNTPNASSKTSGINPPCARPAWPMWATENLVRPRISVFVKWSISSGIRSGCPLAGSSQRWPAGTTSPVTRCESRADPSRLTSAIASSTKLSGASATATATTRERSAATNSPYLCPPAVVVPNRSIPGQTVTARRPLGGSP